MKRPIWHGFWMAAALAYSLCALLALWFIPASAQAWLGVEPDPLSALPAMLLALPWSLLLGALPDDSGPFGQGLLLAAGLCANAGLLWWLVRRSGRHRR